MCLYSTIVHVPQLLFSFSSRECDKKATKGHDIYSRFVELSSDMETIGRELYLKMFS